MVSGQEPALGTIGTGPDAQHLACPTSPYFPAQGPWPRFVLNRKWRPKWLSSPGPPLRASSPRPLTWCCWGWWPGGIRCPATPVSWPWTLKANSAVLLTWAISLGGDLVCGQTRGAELIWEKRQLWSGRAGGVGINPGVWGWNFQGQEKTRLHLLERRPRQVAWGR